LENTLHAKLTIMNDLPFIKNIPMDKKTAVTFAKNKK